MASGHFTRGSSFLDSMVKSPKQSNRLDLFCTCIMNVLRTRSQEWIFVWNDKKRACPLESLLSPGKASFIMSVSLVYKHSLSRRFWPFPSFITGDSMETLPRLAFFPCCHPRKKLIAKEKKEEKKGKRGGRKGERRERKERGRLRLYLELELLL